MKPSRDVRRPERQNADPNRSEDPGTREHPILSAAKALRRALIWVWTAPVRLYRRFLSPLKGRSSCRYTPTCSAYAVDAVEEWGILCGTLLAVFRIIRCNPFSRGGYDPVPRRAEVFARIRSRIGRTASPDASPTENGGKRSDDQSSPMER